jgi:hypothetical protein
MYFNRTSFKGFQICPFNKSHLIIPHKMPIHILKCEKNYRGPALVSCRYNATHMMLPENMDDHLNTCPDFIKNYRLEDEISENS